MRENFYKNYSEFYSSGISDDMSKVCSYYEDDYRNILPKNKDAKIFDIGCGMGHFLYYLLKKGYHNIKGVDICREQVNAAKKLVSADIQKISDLKSYLSKSTETFDVITMNDVLEHLDKKEIIEVLGEVKNKLNPSGIFICRVPNMSNIFGIYLLYNDFTHEIGFTEHSITQVLRSVGFEDIAVYGNKTRINSFWKKVLFNAAQRVFFSMIKLILAYIYMPGSRQPKIMTTFLIAVSAKSRLFNNE